MSFSWEMVLHDDVRIIKDPQETREGIARYVFQNNRVRLRGSWWILGKKLVWLKKSSEISRFPREKKPVDAENVVLDLEKIWPARVEGSPLGKMAHLECDICFMNKITPMPRDGHGHRGRAQRDWHREIGKQKLG